MNRLDLLWDLQQVDLELASKTKQYREAQSQLGESEELVATRQAIHEMEGQLRHWQARLRDLELELESLEAKIAQGKESLYSGRVTNPKELTSLQQDIEYLGRRKDSLEDDILEAMGQVDERQEALQATRQRLEGLDASWTENQTQLKALIQELTGRIRELQAKRAELSDMVPKADLLTYDDIRRRKGGQAMSMMQGSHCESCHVSMPSGKQQQLRRKEDLVLCEGCGRILYVL